MNTDTTSKAEAIRQAIFSRMSGEDRLLATMNLSDEIRDITLAGFKSRHPQLPEEELWTLFFREIHQIEIKRE
ncbi:MAG: hypothetical protein HY879_24515 [Deltaproteobacteria bacterium]|nr:hypothetical protein [Deltaproteobacteria bacterium]